MKYILVKRPRLQTNNLIKYDVNVTNVPTSYTTMVPYIQHNHGKPLLIFKWLPVAVYHTAIVIKYCCLK